MEGHVLNWTPGNHGKGIVVYGTGQVHTWNTDPMTGDPHHSKYLGETLGWPEDGLAYKLQQPFEIGPEGTVYGAESDIPFEADPRLLRHPGEWAFQSAAPKTDQVLKMQEPLPQPLDNWENNLDDRIPVIWHPQHRNLYIGAPGYTHTETMHFLTNGRKRILEALPGGYHPVEVFPEEREYLQGPHAEDPSYPEFEKHMQQYFPGYKNVDAWQFRGKVASSRSLYHGTLIDHLPSIQQHGLIPDVGGFTSDAYELDPEGRFTQDDDVYHADELGVKPVVFMADKARLQRAHNAIVHGVSRKLNKPSFQLTPQDIQEHGLLVKQPGQMGEPEHTEPPLPHIFDDNVEEGHDPWDIHRPRYEEHPFQAEPGDFYSESPIGPSGLQFIHGPAMMRVFDRYGVQPPINPMTWQRQSATGHQLNWEPDQHGKGIVDEQGNVHTWITPSADGYPSHPEYVEKHMLLNENTFTNSPMWDRAFQINPKGDVRIYGPDIPEEPQDPDYDHQALAQAIQMADPRLRATPQERQWTFGRVAKNDQKWQLVKHADKLHDFLMNPKSRPDLQTPEGQDWLNYLERLHNDKTDPLMPWLTREWKKGRIEQAHGGGIGFPGSTDAQGNQLYKIRAPEHLNHWGDFLQSDHPLRRELGDIMQHHVGDFDKRIDAWNEDMANKADEQAEEEAAKGGKVVHKWPDNWTVRQLHTPEELEAEGDAMGHCVGSYAHQVENGNTLIYSLRDPQGKPHVTTEIRPEHYEWTDSSGNVHRSPHKSFDNGVLTNPPIPNQGEVQQFQGKSNSEPVDEYKRRMRDWFETFPEEERPTAVAEDDYLWDPRDIRDIHEHPEGVDEYGLRAAPVTVDWEQMLENMAPGDRPTRGWENYSDEVYDLAKRRGEIPQLAKAWQPHEERQQDSAQDMVDQNYDYIHDYVGPNPETIEHDPEEEEWEDTPSWSKRTPEEQTEAMREWEENEQEAIRSIEEEHEGYKAASELGNKLQPHYNGEAYVNDPKTEPPQTEHGQRDWQIATNPENYAQFGPGGVLT